MPDNNLSAPAGPVDVPASTPTEDEIVGDIADLLDDSPASANPAPDDQPEAAAEEDDPLGLAEDVAQEDAENPDGSEEAEIKGGRFAPDSAKTTLDDGTVITVAELKRNNLFQRDYTQKRQEDAEARKAFDIEREQVSQYAQQLDQSREYLAWYAEQNLPKQPGPPPDPTIDPYGYQVWSSERDKWQMHVQAYQQFKASQEADGQRRAGETQKQMQERQKRESMALLNAIPVLKDPVKGRQVWEAIVSGVAQQYGLTQEELNSITDHRIILAMRDGLAYRRIKTAAPQVKAEVARRPVVPGRRAAPNATATREKQARTERLRNSGSFEDGVAALQDFDL